MTVRRFASAAVALLAAGTAVTGCGSAPAAATHASFTDGGVAVSVTVERSAHHTVAVTATLRPQQRGFHLYSLTLPDGGVDGLGIPTRLTVAPPLTATGPVTATARPYGLPLSGLGVTLPVYPDGPVTLRLAARLPAGAAPGTARLAVSYGACSAGRCLAPVRARPVAVRLP